jgi:hypothetical protein
MPKENGRRRDWPNLTGTDLSGMTKTRGAAMSRTCAIMASSLRKRKNVSSTITCSVRTVDGLMMSMSSMEKLTGAEHCDRSSRQGWWTCENIHWLGVEEARKAKQMKKKFSELTKLERARLEADYHRMKPEELDEVMSRARSHSPDAIRLSPGLARKLKTVAESRGEPEYRTMAKKWLEERLRQTTKVASTSSQDR